MPEQLERLGLRYGEVGGFAPLPQKTLNGKPVDWMEKVSDEQYQM